MLISKASGWCSMLASELSHQATLRERGYIARNSRCVSRLQEQVCARLQCVKSAFTNIFAHSSLWRSSHTILWRSTGCSWKLTARLVLHGTRRWAISVTGAHGKRRETLVYKSRNPMIKPYLLDYLENLKACGQPPSYMGVVEKAPVGISIAEQARCYVTPAQASTMMRNARYQQAKRTTVASSTRAQTGLIIDCPTTLSESSYKAGLAPGGTCYVVCIQCSRWRV